MWMKQCGVPGATAGNVDNSIDCNPKREMQLLYAAQVSKYLGNISISVNPVTVFS